MTSPAVHRTFDPPVPVRILDQGGTWEGLALGWQGEQVHVTYSSGVGLKHIVWVDASMVQRVP